MVGSSMAIGGSGSAFSASQILSPISNLSKPMIAQISPEDTSLTFCLPNPLNTLSSFILHLCELPSRCAIRISVFSFIVPRCTLPMAIRPT